MSKNPWVDKGPQPLMFNPALTTCASERMKTQRFLYFAGFAARERMREAKPVKLKKVAFSHFFDTLMGPSFDGPFCMLFLFLFSGCRNGLSRSFCLPLLHLGVGKAEFLLKGREGIVGTLLQAAAKV